MRKIYLFLLVILFSGATMLQAQVSVTATAGTATASYTTVNDAFTAINAGTHQGVITITVTGNTTEPATPVPLLKSASPSAYTAINIKAQGNVAINSAAAPTTTRALLELTGADNVTIDGDDPATTGARNLSLVMATSTNVSGVISLGSKSTTGADGDSNIVIKNCIITGSRSAVTSTTSSYGIVFSNNATVATISTGAYSNKNVTIQNNEITRCYYGIYAAGASTTYPNSNLLIKGNLIGSATSANNIGNASIYTSYTTSTIDGLGVVIENNDIRAGDYGTTGYSASIYGINVNAGNAGSVIRKNYIHDISQPSVNGYGSFGIGIISATSNNNIAVINNIIRDITASNYSTSLTTSFINYGIYVSAAVTGLNISHNTIALFTANTNGTTANPASACINITSSTATVAQMLNNILVNTVTSTNAYGIITAGTINTSGGNINNNDYYTPNGKVGYYNGAGATTLANWVTATGKDVASVSVNPPFTSATDLHISAGTTPTQLESGGASVATTNIAEDYDGQNRPGPTGSVNGGGNIPDIGADEFDAVPLDLVPPAISYTVFGPSCNTGNRTISAVITDASGVPVSGPTVPRVYFKKGVGGTWYSNAGTYVSGSSTNSIWNFTITPASFGTLAQGDVVYYYIIAQDAATTPNVGSNPLGVLATNVNTVSTHPTTPNTYTVGGPLNGTYTIGAGGNFTTLENAISTYNNSDCLGGAITFRLTDATYTLTSSLVINNATATVATALTIKPAARATTTITGAIANLPLIRINSNYVIIDGSNATGGTTQDLTISNTSATGPSVVAIVSTGTVPVTNVSVKNAILINGVKTSSALVLSDGTTVGTAGYYNNITIQNNNVQNAYIGIFTTAVAASGNGTGLIISSNALNTAGTNNIRYGGIYVQGAIGASISGNDIGGFENTSGENKFGIWLATSTTNTTVDKNVIHDITYTGTSGYGGKGIVVSTGLLNANVNVYNNMISNITGDADSYVTYGATYSPVGIYVYGAIQSGVNIYYNTISLSGNTLNYSANSISIGVALDDGSIATVKNNIIVNKLGLSGTTGTGAVAIAAELTASQFAAIDNNDYFATVTGSGAGYIGRIGSNNYTTLATFKAASGGDVASLNIDPVFVSATNLHLNPTSNTTLENAATPIATITVDIDNNPRSPTNPDMGADEINGPVVPVTLLDLKGERLAGYNKLSWKTVTELNNTGFELQRSVDGINFSRLGFVSSKATNGNSTAALDYNFNDIKPLAVSNYYRLKQIDRDGKFSISNTVLVKGIPNASLQIGAVYPNPVTSTLNLVLSSPKNDKITVVITDLTGRKIVNKQLQVAAGDNNIALNVNGLPNGSYLLKAICSAGCETPISKFVKQ